jgi:hypothetical protein
MAVPATAQEPAELTAALNRERQLTATPSLVVNADLSRAADEVAMRVMATLSTLPGGAPGKPDVAAVAASLLEHFYIPMQLDVLVAVNGSDAVGAIDQWRRSQWPTLGDPALQEVGSAVLWNPEANGPNSRYIWVAVLARPLRTPAESPESPRFTIPNLIAPATAP